MPRLVKILPVLWSVVMVASALTHPEPKSNLFLCLNSPSSQNCDFLSKLYEKRDRRGSSSLTRLCDMNKRSPYLTEAFFDLCSLPTSFKDSL